MLSGHFSAGNLLQTTLRFLICGPRRNDSCPHALIARAGHIESVPQWEYEHGRVDFNLHALELEMSKYSRGICTLICRVLSKLYQYQDRPVECINTTAKLTFFPPEVQLHTQRTKTVLRLSHIIIYSLLKITYRSSQTV